MLDSVIFSRKEKKEILDFLKKSKSSNKKILFFSGPRQSGKTTLIKQVLKEYDGMKKYIAMDEYDEDKAVIDFPELSKYDKKSRPAQWIRFYWEEARKKCKEQKTDFLLVIDEVQIIPNWSRYIKRFYDYDNINNYPVQVVILGSSPSNLQKGISEHLAGRLFEIPLKHWSYSEMSEAFGLDCEQYIYYGGYPSSSEYLDNESEWRHYIKNSIVKSNILRDVLGQVNINKPEIMHELYKLGSESSGQIMSYSKIAADLEGGTQALLVRYLSALNYVGMLTSLSCYASKTHRRKGPPKFQVLNTALMSVAHDYGFDSAKKDREYWGRLVESAVGAHIVNTCHPDASLYYWRQKGLEVDFVIQHLPNLIAIEVKSGKKRGSLKGLEKFKEEFPVTKTLVVGTGGVPIEEFLQKPVSDWC